MNKKWRAISPCRAAGLDGRGAAAGLPRPTQTNQRRRALLPPTRLFTWESRTIKLRTRCNAWPGSEEPSIRRPTLPQMYFSHPKIYHAVTYDQDSGGFN